MELLNAKIKYKAKQFDGNYGPYLGAKATLATGETVGLFSNDLEDRQFLALKPGQAIQLIAEEKRGKTKYKPVYPQESEQPQSQQPQPTTDASDRFSELLDNFAIAYERVSSRFPDETPDWRRATTTGLLIELGKQCPGAKLSPNREVNAGFSALAIAPAAQPQPQPQPVQPQPIRLPDEAKPWLCWRSEQDAIAWASEQLPEWDTDSLRTALAELQPDSNGKKSGKWAEWVLRRKRVFAA